MSAKYLIPCLFMFFVSNAKLPTLSHTLFQPSNNVIGHLDQNTFGEAIEKAEGDVMTIKNKDENTEGKQLKVIAQKSLKRQNRQKYKMLKPLCKENFRKKRAVGRDDFMDDPAYKIDYEEDLNIDKIPNSQFISDDDTSNKLNIKLYTEKEENIIENKLNSDMNGNMFNLPELSTTPSIENKKDKDDDVVFRDEDSPKVFERDFEKVDSEYSTGGDDEMLSAIPVLNPLSPENADILKNFSKKEIVFGNETETGYKPKDYIIDDFETFINKNDDYEEDFSGFPEKEYDIYMKGEESKEHSKTFKINQTTKEIEINNNAPKTITHLTPGSTVSLSEPTKITSKPISMETTVKQNKKKKKKTSIEKNRNEKNNRKIKRKKKKLRNKKLQSEKPNRKFLDQTYSFNEEIMKKIDRLNEQTESETTNDILINEIFKEKLIKRKKLCYSFKRVLLKAEMLFRNCRTLVLGYGNITWNELINVDWMREIGVEMSYEVVRYTKALNPGLRIFLLVRDQWGNDTSFNKMLSSQRNRIKFAHSAMKLLRNVGYDGIEMRFDRPDYYYIQVFNLVKDMKFVFEKHDLFLRYNVPYHVKHPSLKIALSVPSYMINLVDMASIKKSLEYLVLLNKEDKFKYLNRIKTEKTQDVIQFVRTGSKPTSIQIETSYATSCAQTLTPNENRDQNKKAKRSIDGGETVNYIRNEGPLNEPQVFNPDLMGLQSRVFGDCDSWHITFRGSSKEEFEDLINFIVASGHKSYNKGQDKTPKVDINEEVQLIVDNVGDEEN